MLGAMVPSYPAGDLQGKNYVRVIVYMRVFVVLACLYLPMFLYIHKICLIFIISLARFFFMLQCKQKT